jgi:hypothetical protein
MKIALIFGTITCLLLTSCSESPRQVGSPSEESSQATIATMPPTTDVVSHPEHGPRGGELIELGHEDFHIELLHGTGTVEMYILDGSANETISIDSPNLTVSLKHFGRVESFELPALPQTGDAAGMSSRFATKEPKVVAWLDADAEGVIIARIDGKSYTGKLSHADDHAGHEH